MNEKRRFTRRKFLIGSAATLGGVVLAWTQRLLGIPAARAQEPDLTPQVYLPIVTRSDEPAKPCVVHVRDADATDWNGIDPFYNAVDQAVVNSMVQTGLQILTGQESWVDIWSALFEPVHPGGYSAGQKIAIKVNLNMSRECESHPNVIDALPQPVLALISGLVAAGVQPGDVTVYDSIRPIPTYLSGPIWAVYPDVKFLGAMGGTALPCPGVIAPSYGADPSLTVQFTNPTGNLQDRQLADVLYDATYLINMPIIKRHSGEDFNPVTLSFKNHFGSIDRIVGSGDDNLHLYIDITHDLYRTTYSPLVDICRNPNIGDKTILVLGDGLYGGTSWGSAPIQSWGIFGGACNSLFFGTDPVATDCVMADLIMAEGLVSTPRTYDHLLCAREAGLGVCEGTRSDPGGHPLQEPYGSGYDDIEYIRVDT